MEVYITFSKPLVPAMPETTPGIVSHMNRHVPLFAQAISSWISFSCNQYSPD